MSHERFPVRVLFYGGNHWLSRAIQRWTNSGFSHAAIYFPQTNYDYARLYEALGNGIVYLASDEATTRASKAKAFVDITVREHDYLQMESFLDRRAKNKYGFITFLAAGINQLFPRLPLVVMSRRRYICSGLVAEALCKGEFDFDEPRLMTPADLAAALGVPDA